MGIDWTKNLTETAHCPDCNEDVRFGIRAGCDVFTKEDKHYVYNRFEAFCPKCKNEVVVPWIEEYNRKTRERLVKDMESKEKE